MKKIIFAVVMVFTAVFCFGGGFGLYFGLAGDDSGYKHVRDYADIDEEDNDRVSDEEREQIDASEYSEDRERTVYMDDEDYNYQRARHHQPRHKRNYVKVNIGAPCFHAGCGGFGICVHDSLGSLRQNIVIRLGN